MYEKALEEEARLDAVQRELLAITWRMLDAIHTGNADLYAELCTEDLSCFEDVCAYRIDGLKFHLSLIRQMAQNLALQPIRFDILTPRIQVYGGVTGIVTYTRLMTYDDGGRPRWTTFNETRTFVLLNGGWKMAHFHRSPT
ncbi:MAG: Calcium/calmodulin dependent protein kinase Association [Chthonomonadaceae bacterium]|nr:Calcium/calmodulin dependent protein kinase Association [Chthonomonadaceae bacterium]